MNGEKLIAWGIASLGFLVVAYFAWQQLPVSLWHWANEAWWHWLVAIYPFFLLFTAPMFALVVSKPLLAAAGGAGRSQLRWEVISYTGVVVVAVLILWAFATGPEWWARWHWWLWGAALVFSAAVSVGGRMFCTVYEVHAPKARENYFPEWKFNHIDKKSRPELGIAMSGGGIRSAAFNLGVLHALHANGILRNVDVMSAVSGGSYTMSWYLLQPFYAAKAAEREHREFRLDNVIEEMFRPDGRFQTYLCEEPRVLDWIEVVPSLLMAMTLGQPLRALTASSGSVGQYNLYSIRTTYRERLQKLFQGLPSPGSKLWTDILNKIDSRTRWELQQDFSDFSYVDPVTYKELAEFVQRNHLPYFIFNAAVLVQRAYRHMLWPTALELTAHDIGSDVCGYTTWDDLRRWEVSDHISAGMSRWQWVWRVGKLDRELREHRWVLMVNIASAISGAAIGLSYFNPKKPLRQMRLATWTPFFGNLDLGYLLYRELWNEKGTLYVSDGGHSDNLGAYALIKRQCRRIIIVDAEHEPAIPYLFAGYTKLKEQLAQRQEMHLSLTVPDIEAYLASAKGASKPSGPTPAVMTGAVEPITQNVPAKPISSVIYIKLGLDGNRLETYPGSVSEYARENPRFPQDPTSKQSFTSEQFKAYRDLGHYVVQNRIKSFTSSRDECS